MLLGKNFIRLFVIIGLVFFLGIGHAEDWQTTTFVDEEIDSEDPDENNNVGQYTSIAVGPNGKIYISYYAKNDFNNKGNLKLASREADGNDAVWVTDIVDEAADTGLHTSIGVDNYIHVSYYKDRGSALRYATTDPAGGWQIKTLDAPGIVGQYTSIFVDNSGFSHISYYKDLTEATGQLRYATNVSGKWVDYTIPNAVLSSNYGRCSDIAVDLSGRVHISYYDIANKDLRYAVSTGNIWDNKTPGNWTDIEIESTIDTDDTDDTGWYSGIVIDPIGVDGNYPIHIVHINKTADVDSLMHAYKDPEMDWVNVVIDGAYINPSHHVEGYSSITMDSNDTLHISYYLNSINKDLYYLKSISNFWNSMSQANVSDFWAAPEVVDSAGDVGQYNSIITDKENNVHISYYSNDTSNHSALKYAMKSAGTGIEYYIDADNDGYGDNLEPTVEGDGVDGPPPGYVIDNTDCDDGDQYVHPGQTWYLDSDLDGFADNDDTTIIKDIGDCDERPVGNYFAAGELTSCIIYGNESDAEGLIPIEELFFCDCNDSGDTINPNGIETCNGKDDDCNGIVDDGIADIITSCGVGECAANGSSVCTDGEMVDSCTAGAPGTEVCDGLDNNCNGVIDDGIADIITSCGVGECAANGSSVCTDGEMVDSCTAGAPGTEVCDGLDNNCDGIIDDGIADIITSCGVGECAATGSSVCTGGEMVDSCTAGAPGTEVCDGLDNNCDGVVDDGIADIITSCGVGECAATGSSVCTDGEMIDSCTAGTPGTEVCDGLDNNCDGVVDDAIADIITSCGVGECIAAGSSVCTDGEMVDSCTAGLPSTETCDGVDNNCNGVVDDGIADIPTTCGEGECTAAGTSVCTDGIMVDSCSSGTPGVETCDGLDNNCDGAIDDGFDIDLDEIADCYDTCPFDFYDDIDNDGLCADADPYPAYRPVREVDDHDHATLEAALNDPNIMNGDVYLLQDIIHTGNFIYNRPDHTISLIGGYNGDYTEVVDFTKIEGTLTIESVGLILENIIIQ
jgi:Putative metal-binding motif